MMTKEQYEKLSAPVRRNPKVVKVLNRVNKVITIGVYAAYSVTGLFLLLKKDARAKRFLIPPAVGFAGVTLYRKRKNALRPYQVWEIEPLIPRKKDGQSFPSRHTYSIFAIASSFFFLWPVIGIVLLAAGVVLAGTRVIAGVHFVKDVAAGAACGLLTGWIGKLLFRETVSRRE